MTQQNRRDFIRNAGLGTAGFAAAVSTGCNSKEDTAAKQDPKQIAQAYQTQANESASDNLFNMLSRYNFKDQNGETLNVDALKTSIKDQFSTLVSGRGGCTIYCPMINSQLGKLGEMNPDLVSIVISSKPEEDGKTAESRQALLNQVREQGLHHKAILLYPTDEQGNLSNEAYAKFAAKESDELRNPVAPNDNHVTEISLHAPGGNQLDKLSSQTKASEFEAQWKPIMNGQRIR